VGMITCKHCGNRFVDWVDWCPQCKRMQHWMPILTLWWVFSAVLFVLYIAGFYLAVIWVLNWFFPNAGLR